MKSYEFVSVSPVLYQKGFIDHSELRGAIPWLAHRPSFPSHRIGAVLFLFSTRL